VKELRRIQYERTSRYLNAQEPLLNERYLLMKLLGKGGFSEVYKAYDLDRLCYVACKVHQLDAHWDERKQSDYAKHAVREYNIQKVFI
jgi:tousled-like kinase